MNPSRIISISFRQKMFSLATNHHLKEIVSLLANDILGKMREEDTDPLPPSYQTAFQHILDDPNQELWVLEKGNRVIGTFQLTIIPYLTYKGTSRALLEAVRVHEDFRGEGIGQQLLEWAIKFIDCQI